MRYDLTNKIAFISGAANGIGKATALLFSRSGAKVAVVDVQDEAGEAVAQSIRSNGGEAVYIHCDVSNRAEIKRAIERTVESFGGIDLAFNNAGIEGEAGFTADCSEDNWDRTIAINLTGVWLAMKYQIPEMIKRGGGAIVNCSSIAGIVGTAGVPAYNASKHGVVGLTETAALEYINQNIRINAVCPGVIHTPMIDRFTRGDDAAVKGLVASEPIGRMGRPEEVAEAVAWLCSDASTFVIGHAMPIDGGWVAR